MFRKEVSSANGQLESLKPIGWSSWHRGSRYFRAVWSPGQVVFIKTDGVYKLLNREICTARHLVVEGQARGHIPVVRCYSADSKYPFAAFEWVNGLRLDHVMSRRLWLDAWDHLTQDLLSIVVMLARADVVHRDITPENLIVRRSPGGSVEGLVLIDHAFAITGREVGPDAGISRSDLVALCSGFKPSTLTWDDAYSCWTISQQMEAIAATKFGATTDLAERVGRRNHTFIEPN